MTQTCPQCARDNAPGNRFCIFCAQPLPARDAAQAPDVVSQTAEQGDGVHEGVAPPPAAVAPQPILCPQCAGANDVANLFCISCGFPLEAFRNDASLYRKVCQGCSAPNEATFAYCYRCGLALPRRLLLTAQVGGNPAGFWIRLLAFVIDSVLLFASGILITWFFAGFSVERTTDTLLGESTDWASTLVSLTFDMAYYTFLVGYWGRTLGKAVLGLKVTRMDGSGLSYTRAFARYWAYLVSALPLGMGFLAIALSAQKRGWHDFMCDTRVVRTRQRRVGRPASPQ